MSAWDGETLVGAANAIADGHLVVYYPYVVVHPDYQRAGIGSELVRRMQARYATYRQQVLLSATGAVTFYERLGFSLSRAPGMQLEPPPQLAVESRPL